MEEQASFETRAVLAPRRARLARLALLLPALALVAVAWAGLSGAPSDTSTADVHDPTPMSYPGQVLGLPVHGLNDVLPRRLGSDDVVAIAGWYVPMAITDCPPLPAIYRDGALPFVRGDADTWAFCKRSGVLYAAAPQTAGVSAVATTLAVGIIAPLELETIGNDATEVVVLGRFVEAVPGCRGGDLCARQLVVDHVAWTPGA